MFFCSKQAFVISIRMAKETRWKAAFRSVLELFEYMVVPFEPKGAPATFQANINASLQTLIRTGRNSLAC